MGNSVTAYQKCANVQMAAESFFGITPLSPVGEITYSSSMTLGSLTQETAGQANSPTFSLTSFCRIGSSSNTSQTQPPVLAVRYSNVWSMIQRVD